MFYAIIQYHGANFCGWQRQLADRTVQGELEAALSRLAADRVVAHAAGRTDAGVHALGQVVSFDLPRRWDEADLLRALNATTPADLWVVKVGLAPPGFHARKHAVARRYRYVIGVDAAAASPFRRPFEWAVRGPIDPAALHAGAARFLGEHDFRGYAAAGPEKPHYRCTLTTAEWRERPDAEGFIFTVEANRFLHRMVRFLVGAMVDVARGRRPVADLAHLLECGDNQSASPPAPPHGLYFVSARYPQLEPGTCP